jgi:hypothetical protein
MPFRLPLALTVKAIQRSKTSIDVVATIADADGQSVQSMPIQMGPATSASEVEAILQATVTTLATKLHGRKEALVNEVKGEFEALSGRVFRGGVAL